MSDGDTCIALLRGINVGGRNKLPMKELAALFTASGCADVRTYIQSGNVLFRAERAGRIAERIAADIAQRFGYRVPVVVRAAAELRRVVDGNPFLAEDIEAGRLHVAFLAQAPAAAAVAALDPRRSPPDRFQVVGREVYLDLPNGVARSKLTNAYFDSKLGTVSTLRNWKTVCTLLDLADGR